MSDCPATATILLDGQPTVVICNLPDWHTGQEHEDIVLGVWRMPPSR